MKVVILAGGLGSRLSEETETRPKPMVEIGGKPILWHIMKIYSSYGLNDFIICLGYKGYLIKEYFANYYLHMSDVTIDLRKNRVETHQNSAEPWRVTLVETGEQTMTGGRLRRVREYLGDDDFCMTYGDGLSDVNVSDLVALHKRAGRLATLTATVPPSRFGRLDIEDKAVHAFLEKPEGEAGWINGGYMVLNPRVLDYIADDGTVWEREPLERLAREGQLTAFEHEGFFQPMDTLRDKVLLEDLWRARKAPWKVWP